MAGYSFCVLVFTSSCEERHILKAPRYPNYLFSLDNLLRLEENYEGQKDI